MATRGAKPKAAHLRLVDGTHRTTRHGDTDAAKEAVQKSIASFGKLTKPKHVKGAAAEAWKRYIEPAGWLDGSRELAAVALCELASEFRSNPSAFTAGKHGQLRAYMSELGLTDERNRIAKEDEAEDEFFG
jgi:hypothetical protein